MTIDAETKLRIEKEARYAVAFRNAADALHTETSYDWDDLRDMIDQLEEDSDE